MHVTHNAQQSRFEIVGEGGLAVLEYRREGRVWDLHRTYVPDRMRGMGVAGVLARTALEHIREEGGSIRPSCSYIESFVGKNPEFAALIENRSP